MHPPRGRSIRIGGRARPGSRAEGCQAAARSEWRASQARRHRPGAAPLPRGRAQLQRPARAALRAVSTNAGRTGAKGQKLEALRRRRHAGQGRRAHLGRGQLPWKARGRRIAHDGRPLGGQTLARREFLRHGVGHPNLFEVPLVLDLLAGDGRQNRGGLLAADQRGSSRGVALGHGCALRGRRLVRQIHREHRQPREGPAAAWPHRAVGRLERGLVRPSREPSVSEAARARRRP